MINKYFCIIPVTFSLLIVINMLQGCATTSPPPPPEQLKPIKITLVASQKQSLAPSSEGLELRFQSWFYNSIDDMLPMEKGLKKGIKGQVLYQLNHKFVKDEQVFGTGIATGIGFYMNGFLHFEKPGTYRFQALSNDGLEITLGRKLLISDPPVHGDRMSTMAIADVAAPGWYPIKIRYYQKKGTATLKLYWQPPGSSKLTIVPEKIYGHNPTK